MQTDVGLGIRFTSHLEAEATTNLAFRNYGLASEDFVSAAIRFDSGPHAFRAGPIAGIYTLWLSRYSVVFPGYGLELVYGYALAPEVSVRVKERFFTFPENGRENISTATLLGICFDFGSVPDP